MRILFCCTAAEGHFAPLVPLATAARAFGHEVAFATGPRFGERVRELSFDAYPVGIDIDELERRFEATRAEIRTLPPAERRARAYSGRFGEVEAPARIDELHALVHEHRPDVIVHESAELAAPVVAAANGIPSVNHNFGRAIPAAAVEAAARVVAPLWERAGIAPDPWAGAYRGRYVDVCPPSLQLDTIPADRLLVRPVDAAPRAHADGRPAVYVTLGTVFGASHLFRLLLDALADADCDVLMTVGHAVDPAELGPPPANAVVERFVPQAQILPRVRAVVTHGGSGSTIAALAHACPLVLVPQGADQFDNAAACAEASVGVVVLPPDQSTENLRTALETVLAEPSYREAAQRIAAEIAAMPSAMEVATALFP